MSQIYKSSTGSAPASGIESIVTDDGTITGSTVTIFANHITNNAGSSVEFAATSGTVSQLNVTDADENTLVGSFAGNLSLTGTGNTGFGAHSLASLSTGAGNAALGLNSLVSLTSGNSNVGVGGNSLGSIQADFGNTAIGFNSLPLLNGGNQNTSIGTSAGANITTGSFNIFIGNSAGQTNTTSESSNIYLNSFGVVAESNSLRIGRATGTSFEQLNKAFISGINGVTLGGTPLVVTIDAATDQLGVAAFPSGGSIIIDGDSGSATGSTITLTALDGADNSGSTVQFSASGSTVVLNVSNSGDSNTLLGLDAGNGSVSGGSNTGFGVSSLHALTSGQGNCAFGVESLLLLQNGNENTAIGLSSLTNCIGASTNTAVGYASLLNVATGDSNTSMGAQSGSQLLTGSFNSYIGFESGVSNTGSESSNIYINTSGAAEESNVLRIGLATGTDPQDLAKAFIAGINGNTLGGTPLVVTIDSSTDQLGVSAFPSGEITIDGDSGSATGSTITFTALDGADNSGSSVSFVASAAKVVLNLSDPIDNVILGKNAGNSSITGIQNMGMGALSLQHCNTGQNNVGIGWGSLFQLTSGQSNVAIGTVAGVNIRDGAYNINIGMSAGNNIESSESSDIYLNSQGVEDESNTLRIGQATGTGNQELSTAFIHGINGNTLGGTPLVVTIDSSTDQLGVAAFPSGGSVTFDGDSGSATGSTITLTALNGANNSGATVFFTASAAKVLLNVTDASNNTLIGFDAGNGTLTGIDNTGVGRSALAGLTSGEENIALGQQALEVNTSGSRNIGIGSGSLGALITGDNNICIGTAAGALLDGAQSNIAIGTSSLANAISSLQNVAVGLASLEILTGGGQNVAIGASAGQNVDTGEYNLYLGWDAGVAHTGAESYNILLSSAGVLGESGALRIGDVTGVGPQSLTSAYICGINGVTLTGTPKLVTIDASTNQLGVSATLATAPPSSNTATTGFGAITPGTALQNTLGYDILVTISVNATAAVGAAIVSGVGPTSTPMTNAITAAFSVATVTTFSQAVPSGYYLLVNTTGTITIGSTTTQVTPL